MRECTDCGEKIAIERLAALPAANLCINCAEDIERKKGYKVRTMEVVVKGQDFDSYDGYEQFMTSGKWRRPRSK